VRPGDALGTVGTTGNASPQTPHLHYAIARIPDSARWWAGTPVNPYPLLTGKATIEEGGAVPATQAAAPDSARRAPGRARTPEPTTPAARAREAREASRRGG
jgi:hypothetical protein